MRPETVTIVIDIDAWPSENSAWSNIVGHMYYYCFDQPTQVKMTSFQISRTAVLQISHNFECGPNAVFMVRYTPGELKQGLPMKESSQWRVPIKPGTRGVLL